MPIDAHITGLSATMQDVTTRPIGKSTLHNFSIFSYIMYQNNERTRWPQKKYRVEKVLRANRSDWMLADFLHVHANRAKTLEMFFGWKFLMQNYLNAVTAQKLSAWSEYRRTT